MHLPTSRRRFIGLFPLSGLAVLAACSKAPEAAPPSMPAPTPVPQPATEPAAASSASGTTTAADAPMVDEKDATAASLGYVAVSTRADTARFPNHVAGSQCKGCALYQGSPGSTAGGCPIFAGRRVAAEGWCSSWVKKG